MPIYLHPANYIINKATISKKCKGGIDGFREKFIIPEEPYNQEDRNLFSISRWNVDEFDIDELTAIGLEYNSAEESSNDFAIFQRYFGFIWSVPWLEENQVFAWHIDSNEVERKEVERISNLTFDEIGSLHGKGINILSAF